MFAVTFMKGYPWRAVGTVLNATTSGDQHRDILMAAEAQRARKNAEEAHAEESRAPREYWDLMWQEGQLPRSIDPRDRSLKNHVELKFDALFKQVFVAQGHSGEPPSLAELGCACSVWLPYFSKEFGFRVTGIDYSSLGCDQAKAILAKEGVDGEIVFADIFRPPPDLLNHFDYVVSFGVVEHFEATHDCLKACAEFLKPGGTMITVIPNMNGLVGWLQKCLAREIYDIHVPLDVRTLQRAHEVAGLNILACEYFCFLNFGVLNLNRIRQFFLGLWLSRALNTISAATWILERMGIRLPANRLTSSYVICVSKKTASRGLLGGADA
jgi:cyclopropane fatty-acyl-phospholipid synthase-like methyltransferase